MNQDEFERILGSEPRSRDPEFLAARREDLRLARLAQEAEAFEARLERALRVPVPADLGRRALGRLPGRGPAALRGWPVSVAAAAVLALAVSLAVLLPRPSPPSPLAQAFVEHLQHPEPAALAAATPQPAARRAAALAAAGLAGDALPGEVTYIRDCEIGGARGLHLVVTDAESRQLTILFLPAVEVAGTEALRLEGGLGMRVFATATGAAALVAHGGQNLPELERSLVGPAVSGDPASA